MQNAVLTMRSHEATSAQRLKFARPTSSFNGSTTCVTSKEERGSKPGSNGWRRETQVMSNRSVKVFLSCEFTTTRVTGVHFKKRGREPIILLAGGDKSTQAKDIKVALRLARNLQE